MTPRLAHGQSTMTFNGKPSEQVRSTLKAYGYRWTPAGGYWYCRANADKHLAAVEAVELALNGHHGTCEKCNAAPGIRRRLGWNEPRMILCEKCCQVDQWHPKADATDLLYEDSCRDACGL